MSREASTSPADHRLSARAQEANGRSRPSAVSSKGWRSSQPPKSGDATPPGEHLRGDSRWPGEWPPDHQEAACRPRERTAKGYGASPIAGGWLFLRGVKDTLALRPMFWKLLLSLAGGAPRWRILARHTAICRSSHRLELVCCLRSAVESSRKLCLRV